MASIPLYVPVAITEKRAYTVDIYLCDESAPLDTAHLYVYALPVFTQNYNVAGFASPSASSPTIIWFSAGDLLHKVVSYRPFTATSAPDSLQSNTYPVFDRVSQAYNSSLPWSYSNSTLTVTFNQGTAYPSTVPKVNEFDATAVPTKYVWSAMLVYDDGTNTRIVDGSPVTLDFASVGGGGGGGNGGGGGATTPSTLSVCSSKVT